MSRTWTWRHAILNSDLPATTKHVLMVISVHMNDMGEGCYPTTARLAQLATLSERAVCEHIGKAIELGWLEAKMHGFSGQGWKRNEYRPAWPERTDPDAKGTDFHAEGTDPDDKKALTLRQSNIPSEHSNEHSIRDDHPTKATKRATPRQRLTAHLTDTTNCPAEWANEASRIGLNQSDIDREWSKFCDWHAANGSLMADWLAAWRTWCRKSVEFAARDRARGQGQSGSVGGNLAAALGANMADRQRRERAAGGFGGAEGNHETRHHSGGATSDPERPVIPF